MIFAGGLAFYLMEDRRCKGFEEMMEYEGLGRWRIKNELESEGLGGHTENQVGLRILTTLAKILRN